MKEKAIDFLKKNYIVIICAVCVILSLTALVISLSSGGEQGAKQESTAYSDTQWGEGPAEGIPEFQGECTKTQSAEHFFAAYYKNVKSAQIGEYKEALEAQLGIKFSGSEFPQSASFGEKIIVLHYNPTELEFSVTVVKV